MRITALIISSLFATLNVCSQTLRFSDFEAGIPANYSTNGMDLTTSNEHVKSGTKGLKWVAQNGDQLTVNNLNISSSEIGSTTTGSAQLYVYSLEASADTLLFEFLDQNNVVKRSGRMLLNFKGWRDYHRSYIYDYNNGNQQASFLLNQCRISYRKANGSPASRTLYFDNLKFIGDGDIRQPGPHMALDYPHFKIESPQNPLGAYLKKGNIAITPASPTELIGLATVKSNYARSIGNVSASAVTAAKIYIANCGISRNSDASIKGRGFLATSNPDTLVLISTHIQSLARAFLKNGDNDAKNKLLLFTEYIIDQGVAEGGRNDLATNSYTNARTFPIGFFEALPLYPEPLQTEVINLLKWSNEYNKIYELSPVAGQNTDFVHIKLTFLFETACALTSANEAVNDLKYLKNFLERNADISLGSRDGIKPDGTGFHHQSHHLSYMYAFGTWADRAYALKATPFKISKSAYDHMAFAYKSAFLESSEGGVTANSESGRTPFPAKIPINQTQFKKLVEIGGDITGVSFDPELAAFYNYTYKTNYYATPNVDYDGFYAYNYGNLGVKKSGSWTAVMKGLTSSLFGSEIYAAQNRYGRYQAYGALEILYKGTLENSGYILNGAGWNWNYAPGATTVVLPFNKLQAGKPRADEYQNLDFAGALSLGKNGIFAIDFAQRDAGYYTTSNLKFKKSVFAFDQLLICLGSNISVSNNQGSVVTTLFQTVGATATPTMYVNSSDPKTGTFASSYSLADDYKWLCSAQGTGVYLPKGNNDYRIELGAQTTPDYTSLTGAATNTANFTRAYLVHGAQPNETIPAKYEYVIAPGTSPSDMKTLAQTLASGSIYEVLHQNNDFHAIKYFPENTTAYAFFKPVNMVNIGLVNSISNQALLSVKEYDSNKVLLTINNPNLNTVTDEVNGFLSVPLAVGLSLNGSYKIINNPNGAGANQQGNLFNLSFTLQDGFGASVLLERLDTTPVKLINFEGSVLNNAVELKWASAQEKNLEKFVLYRSTDGISFAKIAELPATQNSGTRVDYHFSDRSFDATAANIYYKLQSVDHDHSISAERIIVIKTSTTNNKISFYPNPISSFINLGLNAERETEGSVQIYSLNGRLLMKKPIRLKAGFNTVPIFLADLNTGEYIIQLVAGDKKESQKFIKL